MNCKQCGAPMNVVNNQNLFHCEYCGGYDFSEPNLDGVALLDEPSSFVCPTCKQPLVFAIIKNVGIFSCPACRGNLIDQSKMLSILRQTQSSDLPCEIPATPLNKSELARTLVCPSCQKMMTTYPYGGPGNVIIQGCDKCRMIWLDFGELSKVMHAYAQMYSHSAGELGAKENWVAF
jgi:Zn-finger nucleic acid-binding protein